VKEATAYEVRCHNCQTSFAPETRRCVHCGGPLGKGRILASVPVQHGVQPHVQPGLGSGPQIGRGMGVPADEEAEDFELATRSRNRMWVVMAVMAMIASIARSCGG
jgi:hypothetical protein